MSDGGTYTELEKRARANWDAVRELFREAWDDSTSTIGPPTFDAWWEKNRDRVVEVLGDVMVYGVWVE